MDIRNLSTIPKEEIFEAFKKAFRDYFFPLTVTFEQTLRRWELASVDFGRSYGAFDQNELVAFVLHSKNGSALHNFTTGVVPSHRGKHLIEAIYDKLDTKGVPFITLEVIKENTKAINLYKKLGFNITRELISFNGELKISAEKTNHTYDVLPLEMNDEMNSIRLFQPCVENSYTVLALHKEVHEVHKIKVLGKLTAYAVFTPETGSIRELGALEPIDENLDQLFLEMKLNGEKIRIMNIESNVRDLFIYLEKHHLSSFVSQNEMRKDL